MFGELLYNNSCIISLNMKNTLKNCGILIIISIFVATCNCVANAN